LLAVRQVRSVLDLGFGLADQTAQPHQGEQIQQGGDSSSESINA
jgi:hypothetical protein